MDVSFDAFGGGNGWGEQGDQDYQGASSTQRLNAFEKTPIPASITDLLKMDDGEEKFRIGAYTFNTVKVTGVVVSMQADQDQTCITYELNDVAAQGVKSESTFTVIRYQGVDSHQKAETLGEGTYVQAVGKLRSFNNRLSLISFHIAELPGVDDVELARLEAQLALQYYGKSVPERGAYQINEMGIPLFSCNAPQKGGLPGASQSTPGRPASQTVAGAGGTVPGRRLYQQELSNNRGLSGQQARIYDYIKVNCSSSTGVSVDEIRIALQTDSKFSADLNYLLGEGVIYNTVDDNHFAVIE